MSRVIQNGRLDGCQTSSPPSRRSVCRASLARSGDDRMIGPSPRNDRPAGEGCQAVATPAPARPNLLESVPLHLVLTNPAQWTASKRSHPSDSSWPQPAAQLAQQPRSANDRCLAVTCRTMPRASKGGPRPRAVGQTFKPKSAWPPPGSWFPPAPPTGVLGKLTALRRPRDSTAALARACSHRCRGSPPSARGGGRLPR